MTAPSSIIESVAYDLLGTCKTIEEVCEAHGVNYDDISREGLAQIDDITMLCDSCSWWVESGDINDNQECTHCAEEAE